MSNPAFLKKMKKVNRHEVEEDDDQDELENEDEEEPEDGEEVDGKRFIEGAKQKHPVVGKTFKLKHVIHAVPDDTSAVDHSTHDPMQSESFKNIHDHAHQSLNSGLPHHHALHKFHKTAKEMIDANYPEPKHKKATIKKIREKWLGGK